MTDHRCDIPGCDGTKLGHELAADFPRETAAVDAALERLLRRALLRRDAP